jgi:uncharacterized protein with HEPN domain
MSRRDNQLLFLDMLDAAYRIQTYTEGLDLMGSLMIKKR